jgi:hypothetical protein
MFVPIRGIDMSRPNRLPHFQLLAIGDIHRDSAVNHDDLQGESEKVANGRNPLMNKVAEAGLEPANEIDATDNCICTCEFCERCRAAVALHSECFKRQFLASLDAELQSIIAAWAGLPIGLRRALLALIDPQ